MLKIHNKKFLFFALALLPLLIFFFYKNLFNSYFEADEWFHFTNYLPLTQNSQGAFVALAKSITGSQALSEGQHVVPIGEEIFFLNSLFLGINFKPYAFISLLLHSFNSFLVFFLILELSKGRVRKNTLIALCGGIFFALSSIPMHAVTWAAFYGQNILSVTFFLTCVLFLQKSFNTKKKRFLLLSSLFFLLGLLTKETNAVLILIIPLMVFLNKGIFSKKTLLKFFGIPLGFFIPFRFLLPVLYIWVDEIIGKIYGLTGSVQTATQQTQAGLNISLIIYRTLTFPLNMISEVFFSSQTILAIMRIIVPIIYYQYPGEPQARYQNRLFFLYGPGNDLLIYLLAIAIAILFFVILRNLKKSKKNKEAKIFILGFLIIVIGALPIVLNVLRMPWWGTEFFDSRHYYMPSVGAAMIFPFLLLGIGDILSRFLTKSFRIHFNSKFIAALIFILWFFNNASVFYSNMKVIVDVTGYPRSEIIRQMKGYLPTLSKKTIIYAETDGKGAYGPVLPFQTSIPQVLTVAYYDKNHLPDSFFSKFIFDAKSQGYLFSEGRGFGYYTSKKNLAEEILTGKFSLDDVHAFYYDSQKIKLSDITKNVRREIENYLKEKGKLSAWNKFEDKSMNISFFYPQDVELLEQDPSTTQGLREIQIKGPVFIANLKVIPISSGLDVVEAFKLVNREVKAKRVAFDRFQYNDVIIEASTGLTYYIKLTDKLIILNTLYSDENTVDTIDKILGSVAILN